MQRSAVGASTDGHRIAHGHPNRPYVKVTWYQRLFAQVFDIAPHRLR